MGDKSKMMAEHWRSLSTEDKAKYMPSVGIDGEDSDNELSTADKKRIAIRVAKRHQGDVSCFHYHIQCSSIINFYV